MLKYVLALALACQLWPAAAFAQAPAGPSAAPAAKVSISKFRARQLRHLCASEAKEHAKEGQSSEEFVETCYARELAGVAVRRECRAQGRGKGLASQALRDYVKQCAGEKKS